MARYCGIIGYVEHLETSPGVWVETVTKRTYYGDVMRDVRRWDHGEGLNDDLNVRNTISVVADAFAFSHFHAIRYVEWMGARWKVSDVEVQRPRLLLTIGGLYTDDTEGDSTDEDETGTP